MNLSNLKIKPLLLSLILFHAAIAIISWFVFYLSAKNPELIYHSLKSYFIPVDISSKLAKVSWARLLENPYWHISFKELKINMFLKVFQELSHCLIILVDLVFLYLIFNPKRSKTNSLNSLSFKEIFIFATAFSIIGVFNIPNDSSDIYGYIARGAQQVFYLDNPYQSLTANIHDWQNNIYLGNMLWEKNPAPYGPLFIFICKLIVSLSFNNFWLGFFLFKLLSSGCFLGTVFFINKIFTLENFHDSPKLFNRLEPSLIIPFIALNPFLFYHCSWNGHNDIVMVFFFISSIYSLFKKKFNLALVLMTASILIKYIALTLLPLILIYIWKEIYFTNKALKTPFCIKNSFKYLVPYGSLISLILSFLVFNYYDFFSANFSAINTNITLSHKSLFNSIETIYKLLTHNEFPQLTKYLFLGTYALFAMNIYIKFWSKNFSKDSENSIEYYDERNRNLNYDFLKLGTLILAALILIASPKFHSWYLVIVLPLGFLVYPEMAVILSISHLLSFTFIDQANILNYILMTVLPISLYFLLSSVKSRYSINSPIL